MRDILCKDFIIITLLITPRCKQTRNNAKVRPGIEPAEVVQIEWLMEKVRLDAVGFTLVARITRRSAPERGLRPGLKAWAQIKAAELVG